MMKNKSINKKVLILIFLIVGAFLCNVRLNDDNAKLQPYHVRLSLEKLWNYSKGAGQKIAIIDSGLTAEAFDLFESQIIAIFNSFDQSTDVTDDSEMGHGTHLASLMIGNGFQEVYGISPEAELIIVKAFNGSDPSTNVDALVRGILFAIENDATIINLSFGGFVNIDEIAEVIAYATSLNIPVVASAGDYGQRDVLFPANLTNVIGVGGIDANGLVWEFSNTGVGENFRMFGVDILGLTHNNQTATFSGTSQATAMTSGYIALLKSYSQTLNVDLSVRDIALLLNEVYDNGNIPDVYDLPFQRIRNK